MRPMRVTFIALLVVLLTASLALANAMDQARAGAAAHQAKQYQKAIGHFTKSLQAGGLSSFNTSVVYEMRADCYEKLGKYQLALDDYNRALNTQSPDMKPRNRSLQHNARGLCLLKMGKQDQALADFSKAIELFPQYHHPYLHRARIYKKMGQKELAIADIKQFIKLKPQDRRGPELLRQLQAK